MEVLAAPAEAAQLGVRCRSIGLDPVMMFSTVNFEAPDALEAHRRRIDQAHAAKVPFIITFGKTSRGEYDAVIRNLKGMAEHANGSGVTVLIKQHGGNTATGEDCSRILRDVAGNAVSMCYDAGNVLDYENHDPIVDIQKCWRDIRAFAIRTKRAEGRRLRHRLR
ncbi:MAG: TIM barrel protein [Bryobacteraceae bacterium]